MAALFEVLSVFDLDFSMDVTGFEMSEIEVMLEGLAPAGRGKEDPEISLLIP